MEDTEYLKNISLFDELTEDEILLIQSICKVKDYAVNSVIIEEMSPPSGLYILQKGSVKIQKIGADSKMIDIATLYEGDHFGEMSLIDSNPTSAQVTVLEDTSLIQIPSDSFSEVLSNNINIGFKIYKQLACSLSKRLRYTDDSVVIFKKEEDEKRFETLKQAANTVCHYINNPLAAIYGLAQITLMKLDGNEIPDVRKNLEIIQEQVKRIERVVIQLARAVKIVVERVAPGIDMIDLDASGKK